MDLTSLGEKPKPKLSRAEVREILERNINLYKEEESLVAYLVELALYLLEYEYDWAESGSEIPPNVAQTQTNSADGTGVRKPEGMESYGAIDETHRECPICGARIGDMLVCPACRNLTR